MMTKFYVGQKVLVKDSTFYPCPGATGFIGKVGYIKGDSGSCYCVWNEDQSDWFGLNASDLEPITETQEEITVNGVKYVRKPEPDHVWKFGDVAVHEDYGVGIVTRTSENLVLFETQNGITHSSVWLPHSRLTFLRRADLSV